LVGALVLVSVLPFTSKPVFNIACCCCLFLCLVVVSVVVV